MKSRGVYESRKVKHHTVRYHHHLIGHGPTGNEVHMGFDADFMEGRGVLFLTGFVNHGPELLAVLSADKLDVAEEARRQYVAYLEEVLTWAASEGNVRLSEQFRAHCKSMGV